MTAQSPCPCSISVCVDLVHGGTWPRGTPHVCGLLREHRDQAVRLQRVKHHPQGWQARRAEVHTLWGSGCASSPPSGLRRYPGPRHTRQGWPCSLPGFLLIKSLPGHSTAWLRARSCLEAWGLGGGEPGLCFTDSSRRSRLPSSQAAGPSESCESPTSRPWGHWMGHSWGLHWPSPLGGLQSGG